LCGKRKRENDLRLKKKKRNETKKKGKKRNQKEIKKKRHVFCCSETLSKMENFAASVSCADSSIRDIFPSMLEEEEREAQFQERVEEGLWNWRFLDWEISRGENLLLVLRHGLDSWLSLFVFVSVFLSLLLSRFFPFVLAHTTQPLVLSLPPSCFFRFEEAKKEKKKKKAKTKWTLPF
jgi:hypothetical protein